MNLVLHTIQARHQQRGKAQVGIGRRVGETGFDAAGLGRSDKRNANRGGAVFGRVGQLDRRFEVRHEALVAVGGRVGDGIQRLGVLDDATNVEQREFTQAGVAVSGKEVLAVFPDRLMHVHAGTAVADDGFGHEGRRFAVLVGDVVHDVLEDLGPVGPLNQGGEFGADLALAGAGGFVVMYFHRYAQRFQGQHHGRADVMQAVDRRDREIAALDGWPVAAGAHAVVFLTGAPGGFVRVDLQIAAGHVDGPFDAIENEKFGFRAKKGGIAQAGGLQVGFSTLGDGARVAVVAAAIGGIDYVTGQDQRGFVVEGVDVGRVGVRHHDHVGGLHPLPAGNR